jgi:NTP pyrophosphatase (non-canonical NTP hydrolase)
MDLNQLTVRALHLRDRFSALEQARSGRPWSREELMQGFVGDVGDLAKLVMAKQGLRTIENVDAKLAHELADCLWSVLVLSHSYQVDLEAAFLRTVQELEARIDAELNPARAST